MSRRGITQMLMSRQQLIDFFMRKQREYLTADDEDNLPIKEQNFSEYLADGLIEEVNEIQDRR